MIENCRLRAVLNIHILSLRICFEFHASDFEFDPVARKHTDEI